MSKYEKFSKEELMALVEKQDAELASKKYGLVWDSEREPEQVVLDCENNLPILKRVKGKEIREPKGNGLEDNILIEGDNYHALSILNFTHQGAIDAIYADPPYNTGAKNWRYNNDYVDRNDAFRHSKWLNFMKKRLLLAKSLLKEDGVIVVTIDDYEVATLTLLMDGIFGEENRLGTVVIKNNPQGRSSVSGFQVSHEYALFYGRTQAARIGRLPRTQEQVDRYKELDSKGPFEWRNFRAQYSTESPKMKYPIFVKKDCSGFRLPKMKWNTEEQSYDLLEEPDESEQVSFPIDSSGRERTWKWSIETVKSVQATEMGVRLDKDKNPAVYYKGRMQDEWMLPYTVWDKSDYSASAMGANLLSSLLGAKKFDYPKSLYAVRDAILVTSEKKDATILDFFAGSGTTGHAVLELNKEDGGNRKFILCTNNENKICEEVTYPRLQKVIKGYKKNGDGEKVEGLGGNLQYFKTDLLKQTKNKDQVRIDLTYKCTEMLCVKENIFNLEVDEEDYKVFSSNSGDRFLCVYYNLFDESFADFLKEIKKLKGEKKVYMFSADGRVDSKLFAGVKDCEVEEIPQKIVEVYRRLVKMNIPVKADTIFLDFEKAQKKVFEESEKDEGARILRIVLEKTIQKIAQKNNMSIFKENHREEKIDVLNSLLKDARVFNKVQWEENKTYLAIGNHAAHGDYGEYVLKQVENFYRHVQSLFNDFGI